MAVKELILEIKSAQYIKDYQIRLVFNDGKNRVMDFGDFLNSSLNPMTRKYLKKPEFRNFEIRYGDLIWGDYEMCFPIWDLHEGKI
ncbi:MAG: DUF2442 domain-containing protein [Ignavibacteria bacterium]|nr:DUF2442 domain-containing protein [Ignavibacteria bacterium]